ncbi:MAG: hypothetical protein QME94_18790 [Anaerolineae bacterium]|nr:hypothetical protein [Anaerolineae bacterium]
MPQIPFIVVPKVLRDTLGEDGAEALVGLLNQLAAHELRELRLGVETAVNNLAVAMTQEFSSLRARSDEGDNALRTAMQDSLAEFRTAMDKSLATLRSDMERGDNALRTAMQEGLAALRSDMEKGLAALRSDMEKGDNALREGLAALRLEIERGDNALRIEIHRTHASQIKWMFVFWVGQVAVILGILRLLGVL